MAKLISGHQTDSVFDRYDITDATDLKADDVYTIPEARLTRGATIPVTGTPLTVHVRDYYRVEDDTGARYWLFRAGLYGATDRPKWWMHGLG